MAVYATWRQSSGHSSGRIRPPGRGGDRRRDSRQRGTSIWPQAVLRGDYGTISVGIGSNIQDGTVIHCTAVDATVIGSGCVVGHNAHIEGSTIEDHCLIASGSVVLNGTVIGDGVDRRRWCGGGQQDAGSAAQHGTRCPRQGPCGIRGSARSPRRQRQDVRSQCGVLPRRVAQARLMAPLAEIVRPRVGASTRTGVGADHRDG